MKHFYSLILFVWVTSLLGLQAVEITEASGWLESAYAKWLPVPEAVSYKVCYLDENSNEIALDGQLIRNYGTYFRADALGLKAGTYKMSIKAIGAEGQEISVSETSSLTVLPHDRSGFAHAAGSPKKSASGAYNDDGTLKAGAQVIYVTPVNAQELNIYETILKPREKKDSPLTPTVIRFIGTIKAAHMPGINSAGLLQLKGNNASYEQQFTLEGVGDDAYLEFGLDIVRCSNVEIRNLGFKHFPEDAVSVQSNNTNIWIHNNDFFYGQNKGGDKKKGDGATDIKDSQWCTLSYNHYWDSGKANLFGNSDDAIDYISYHHNFLDHSDSRHPRVRCAQRMHVYNNYFRGVGKYAVGAARQSSIFVEANYFENTKNPMLSSKQGTDILDGDGSGTFSGEDGGIIKAYNNVMAGLRGNYRKWESSGQQNTEFDAYEVTNRTDMVPNTVKAKQGGAIYSNFDQELDYKEFKLDTPEDAKLNVEQFAGRVQGGDMKIVFGPNDYLKTDDPDPAIKAVIDAHVCRVVDFGDGGNGGGEEPEEPGGGEVVEGDEVHNFTTQGKTNTFYSISGNLSTGKGAVEFGGLTLTQCLKMESSTSITFETTKPATLTLVFLNNSKTVKIDDDAKTPDGNGIVVINIPAGSHTITRGSGEAYLYYMSIVYDSLSSVAPIMYQLPLTLYPNPTTDKVHIGTLDTEVQSIQIYTVEGRLVTEIVGNRKVVDMNNLPKGQYLIRVTTQQGIAVGSVIKQDN